MQLSTFKLMNCNTVNEAFGQLTANKDLLYNNLYNAIIYGINNDILLMPIFYLELKGSKLMQIKCHRNNWNIILEELKNYYIEIEEYEKCSIILKCFEKL